VPGQSVHPQKDCRCELSQWKGLTLRNLSTKWKAATAGVNGMLATVFKLA